MELICKLFKMRLQDMGHGNISTMRRRNSGDILCR